MDREIAGLGDLRGLGPSGERAIASAEREARELGHDRIGTEHLLLGLLTNDSDTAMLRPTPASRWLQHATR